MDKGARMVQPPGTEVEQQATATIRQQVRAAYRVAEAETRTVSLFRLRWMARRALRHADGGDHRDLARLAAIRNEFRRRGQEMPAQ